MEISKIYRCELYCLGFFSQGLNDRDGSYFFTHLFRLCAPYSLNYFECELFFRDKSLKNISFRCTNSIQPSKEVRTVGHSVHDRKTLGHTIHTYINCSTNISMKIEATIWKSGQTYDIIAIIMFLIYLSS